MNYDAHFKLSCQRRDDFWKSIGTVNPDVISNLINPTFMGGPKWPSLRQAHLEIQIEDGTILSSDGLSDPYDDFDTNPENQAYNGLGLELYIISENKFSDLNAAIQSWEFSVLRQLSHTSASNPNLVNMLNEYRFISTSISGDGLPESFIDENGSAGVLLGLENTSIPKKLELSIETIALVNIVLLKPKELEYIMKNGAQGRIEVGEKLATLEKAIISSNERPSVIE